MRLKFRFPDVEPNPGQRRPVHAAFRIMCSNLRGLSKNICDLTAASAPKFESGYYEMLVVCGARQHF